ncbi:hypothetical protein SRHO_G00208000 [Serrasalmus rhombeus]
MSCTSCSANKELDSRAQHTMNSTSVGKTSDSDLNPPLPEPNRLFSLCHLLDSQTQIAQLKLGSSFFRQIIDCSLHCLMLQHSLQSLKHPSGCISFSRPPPFQQRISLTDRGSRPQQGRRLAPRPTVQRSYPDRLIHPKNIGYPSNISPTVRS